MTFLVSSFFQWHPKRNAERIIEQAAALLGHTIRAIQPYFRA
jgi:hypothetical protein